ncbi:AtpZ/AtpI family protein [Candidatus Uhrbacteria bacterium]|nr:AtpZ/AtpI family protein [Candidatus Uhrbacteria bacterium]
MLFTFSEFDVFAMSRRSDRTPDIWMLLGFAGELGYTIAVPVVVLALVGRFLDRSWGTTPWLLLTGVVLAVVVSAMGVTHKIRTMLTPDVSDRTDADTTTKPPKST